jgi:hypothetical protein
MVVSTRHLILLLALISLSACKDLFGDKDSIIDATSSAQIDAAPQTLIVCL